MSELEKLYFSCAKHGFQHTPTWQDECHHCQLDEAIKKASEPQVRVGVAVLVWNSNKLLLHKRKGSHEPGTWSFPGGHQEYGEAPEQTAIRELLEECGPLMACTIPTVFRPCPWVNTKFVSGKQYITLYFECVLVSGEPQVMEPDKNEGWRWFYPNELPSPLFEAIGNGGFDPLMSEHYNV